MTGWRAVGASHEAQVNGRSVLSDRMARTLDPSWVEGRESGMNAA
jgi:hypothetical protein